MSNDTTKECSRCRLPFPDTSEYFPPNRKRKDGSIKLSPECRTCYNARKRDEYQNNIEHRRETARKHQQTEKAKATRREYLKNNPDGYRRYRENHRELYREAAKRYRQNHPDRAKASYDKYAANNPDYLARKRKRNYQNSYAKNPSYYSSKVAKRRAKLRVIEGSFTTAEITELYENQGGVCFYCFEPLGRDFHRDHYVPLSRGGNNYISNIVLSCEACNLSKADKLPSEWKGRFSS